ncbi:hypothetical protein [Pectinatus brassicae]|uniref:Uncharacterized protein n=1 Tax=Pectinatus brassicae TaxID=862415 RepID=A0A840UNL6_9FIRM|nr:hypothetical protein [Pectinatus brassicae]MBB5336288.1 hypothetical protein [Pectinatus brassicae]
MKYSSLTQQIYTKIFITTFVVQIVTTASFFLDFIIPGSFLGEEGIISDNAYNAISAFDAGIC